MGANRRGAMVCRLRATAETKKMLKEFSHLLTKTMIASAAGSGADLLRDVAKQHAPVGETGALKAGLWARVEQKGSISAAYVTGDYRKHVPGRTEGYSPHYHLVEYGTAGIRPAVSKRSKPPGIPFIDGRFVKLGGRLVFITQTGKMPAKPFMRPALDRNRMRIQVRIERSLQNMINKKLREYK